jgi:hypothetical protein
MHSYFTKKCATVKGPSVHRHISEFDSDVRLQLLFGTSKHRSFLLKVCSVPGLSEFR